MLIQVHIQTRSLHSVARHGQHQHHSLNKLQEQSDHKQKKRMQECIPKDPRVGGWENKIAEGQICELEKEWEIPVSRHLPKIAASRWNPVRQVAKLACLAAG